MKNLDKYRNIGISAHIDSGKTTLTERVLYYSGRIHKVREVRGGDGGATMDSMELERERGITIASAATQVQWKDTTINIIDTPGHVDFTVEVERSLRVLDGAVLVLCSVGGVQSQSLTVDRQMKRYGVPRIAFINKMDRTGADSASVIKQIANKLHVVPLPLQIPLGEGAQFQGVVDLVTMQAITYTGDQGETEVFGAIPAEFQDAAEEARTAMLETLSMFSDDLMVALLEEADIPHEDIYKVIRQATLSHEITPVMMGTAFKNKGVQTLLDAVVRFLPSPLDREITAIDLDAQLKAIKEGQEDTNSELFRTKLSHSSDKPLVSMAFKIVDETFGQLTYMRIYQGKIEKGKSYINTRTGNSTRFGRLVRMHADSREDVDCGEAGDIIAAVGMECASGDTFCTSDVNFALESIFVPEPVIRLSIEPLDRDGADRLAKAIQRFNREDPTFHVMTDEETNQTIIAGMGQLHLDVYIERIKREYKVECIVGEPRVAYRETPTIPVEYNHKHKKQTGGSGQYAHVVGKIEPMAVENNGDAYKFVNAVTQGRIPKEYIPAVDKGFKRALVKGPLCECEVVGVSATLSDGSYHDVDSSEMAFNVAGFNCMRDALKKSNMALLEPIMKLEVEVPEEYQGPVSGHIAQKRGVINTSETRLGTSIFIAEVPLANMFDYANELRSMTQGKGGFSMEFARYAQVPRNIQEEVVARRLKEKEERMATA
ncbi:elongation factor G [uncultured Gimesia sp.]|jgi:elongation factor G|uniref:elongation factor G n=1 Tax=uncultured Gimesia sp. TaxID=1678688 RepID=UPI002621FB92|nr:elongation factor G [uncultured Gimesia sp.]